MTMAEIARMDKVFLTPMEVAPLLGCDPHWIRLMARTEDGRKAIGFPVVKLGTRVKVLRIPFLRYLGWEGAINGAEEQSEG